MTLDAGAGRHGRVRGRYVQENFAVGALGERPVDDRQRGRQESLPNPSG